MPDIEQARAFGRWGGLVSTRMCGVSLVCDQRGFGAGRGAMRRERMQDKEDRAKRGHNPQRNHGYNR